MEELYELKDIYMRGIKEFETVKEGRIKMGEVEAINLVTDTIKNIDKICMLEDGGGYSRAGEWEADIRGNYGHGNSYRYRDSDGQYSRDGDMSYNRGGYSRNDGKGKMMEYLEKAMNSANADWKREDIRRMMDKLEKA